MGSPIAFISLCAILPQLPQRCLCTWDTRTIPPPEWAPWTTWQEQLGNSHLTSLTAEIVRDASLRMRNVNVVAKRYEKNLMYKIGAVTASIQNLFARMISIYKDVSNLTTIRYVNWYRDEAIEETIEAISLTQSLLHRIRLEKQLFLEITRHDQEEQLAQYNAMVAKFGKPPGSEGKQEDLPFKPMIGGMYVPRRSNSWYEDQFNAKFDFDNVLSKRLIEETFKPKNIGEKPKKKQYELKKPEKMATPVRKFESRRAGNLSLNPYSDLYRLLGDSRAKNQPTLLKLIPPSGRLPEEKQNRVLQPKPRDDVEPKPSRRSLGGSTRYWESSRSFQNDNKKTPLWQAPTNIQHPYASNPVINKQLANNPHLNDNKKPTTIAETKFKLVTTNKIATETKRLPSSTTKSTMYDNNNSPKMSTNKKVESSTQSVQNDAKTVTQHNPNKRDSDSQKTVTKRPLWQPGPNKQQTDKNNAKVTVDHDSTQSRGERKITLKHEKEKQIFISHHKIQQTTEKYNAELSTSRQEYVSAKQPIWQPGRYMRHGYDINHRSKQATVRNNEKLSVQRYGENRGERTIKQHWNPENNQQKNNAEVSPQEYKKESKPLWQPGENFRQSFDENEKIIRESNQRYRENRADHAVRPYWKQERNHPSPWLYHNNGKATVKQTIYRNNHEFSASVMPQIWQPGNNFRRSYNEDTHIRNNVPQNHQIPESRNRLIRQPPQHMLSERSFMYEEFVKQKIGNNEGVSVKRNFGRREVKERSGGRSFWQPGLIGERSYYDNI